MVDIYIYTYTYSIYIHKWLMVWNMNFIFPYIGNFIIPTDELIFFRGVGTPPTKRREMEHLEISMKYQLEAPVGMAIAHTLR